MAKDSKSDVCLPREAAEGRWVFIFSLVVALVGVVLALELVRVHVQVHREGGPAPACDINQELSCSPVARHAWAMVWGVPTAAWGMLAYAGFALLGVAGLRRRLFPRGPGGLFFWAALAALLFGLFLAWVMAFEIGAWCVYCVGLDLVNLGLFVGGVLMVRQRGALTALREDLAALWANKPVTVAVLVGASLAVGLLLVAYPSPSNSTPSGPESREGHQGLAVVDQDRIDASQAPLLGSPDAVVRIYEFSDYQCPFCRAAHDEMREVMESFEGRVAFAHFHFPLDMACNPAIRRPFHPVACLAAAAAICAQAQDRFWPVNDLLFEHGPELDAARLSEIVREADLDQASYEACMSSESPRQRIARDLGEAAKVPVEATPTFVVNGRVISGYQEGLYRVLIEELVHRGGQWPSSEEQRETSPR